MSDPGFRFASPWAKVYRAFGAEAVRLWILGFGIVSKDSDFFYSHVLEGRPWKLLLVRTGNISTRELVSLFERNLAPIESALLENNLVEIDHETVRPRTQR